MKRIVTPLISKAIRGLFGFVKSPVGLSMLVLVAVVALHGTAFASTGPYTDTSGVTQAIQTGTGSGQEAAGAIDALRRYWALPVLAAISGIATIVGVIGLLFRGEKKDLFEKLFTYGGIAFLGTAFSTLIVVAVAAYAAHVQGALIH